MHTRSFFLLVMGLFAVIFLSSCGSPKEKLPAFSVEKYYQQPELDTLLTDIITYVGRKNKYATDSTRFDKKWRNYYVKQLPGFELLWLEETNVENEFVFFLKRPARGLNANTRGVGGLFRVNADNSSKIEYLEEFFNTVTLKPEELKNLGESLMPEMLEKRTANLSFIDSTEIIEWPNKYSQYDLKTHTWRATDLIN
jgi:hypothetical protein